MAVGGELSLTNARAEQTLTLSQVRRAKARWTDDEVQRAFDSRSRCQLCPHFVNDPETGVVRVRSSGAKKPTMLVVGEGPGYEESRDDAAFIGPAARHLKDLFSRTKIDLDAVRFTNVVRCLHDRTRVRLEDGTARAIGDLVREKYTGKVLSFDSGRIVAAQVTGHHVSPLAGRRWLKVSYVGAKATRHESGGGVVGSVVTNDHQFLTCDGDWVRADQLDGRQIWIGDTGFGPRASGVLLGTLLGDATIGDGTACLQVVHGADQEEWAQLKAAVLGASCVPGRSGSYSDEDDRVRFHTRASRQIAQLRREFYGPEGKQVLGPLTGFGAQAAATLFMDDGCMRVYEGRRPSAQIATCSFNQASCDQIVAAFRRLGLTCYARPNGDSPYLRIFFTADETPHLVALIDRFVPPSMEYKLGGLRKHSFDPSLWEYEGSFPVAGEAVVEDAPAYYSRSKTAYCLSVEGTQNFLTSAGVAHNCFPHTESMEPRTPKFAEAANCSPYLFDEIEKCDPKVILAVGDFATKALLGDVGSISTVRGKLFHTEIRGKRYPVVPTVHPSADLRGNGRFANGIVSAAASAWGVADRREVPVVSNVINNTTEAIAFLKGLLRAHKRKEITKVAYDLEWGSLIRDTKKEKRSEADRSLGDDLYDPNIKLVAASFAITHREGTCIVLDHVESQTDYDAIIPWIARVVSTIPCVVHGYAKAEGPWTRTRAGVEVRLRHDTMLMSYACYAQTRPHGLKPQANLELGWSDWSLDGDAWMNAQPKDRRSYKFMPLEMMGRYASIDPAATLALYRSFRRRMNEYDLWRTYRRRMKATVVVQKWEQRGGVLDMPMLKRLRKRYKRQVGEIRARLLEYPEVKQFEKDRGIQFNPKSGPQLQTVIYSYFGMPIGRTTTKLKRGQDLAVVVPRDLPAGSTAVPVMAEIRPPGKKAWIGKISGGTGGEIIEIAEITPTGVRLKKPTINDHKSPVTILRGVPSTDEKEMFRILRRAQCQTCKGVGTVGKETKSECRACRGVGVKPELRQIYNFCRDLRMFAKIGLVLQNYLNPDSDKGIAAHMIPNSDRLTFNYLFHTVATGRLSVKDMNIHSFPYESDIRRLLVSRWHNHGGLILAADYSQLEVRGLASVSGDETLRRAYLLCTKCQRSWEMDSGGVCPKCHVRLGTDLHRVTAAVLFNKPEAEITDLERSMAKSTVFGLIYGRGAQGIAEETGISVSDAQEIIDNFFNRFPGVRRYVEKMHDICDEEGQFMSTTGTLLHFSGWDSEDESRRAEARRASQNYPIQGPCGEVTLDAIIALDKRFRSERMKTEMWATVHDSLEFDVAPGELFEASAIARQVMEQDVLKQHDWLTVPVLTDQVIGCRWDGAMKIEAIDGDQLKLSGPGEFYEELIPALEQSYSRVKAKVIETKTAKHKDEVFSTKGYAGGSGRTDHVTALVRLAA